MPNINYDQSARANNEADKLFLGNDSSKLKTPASPCNEIEENKACNICGNQAPCSSRIGNRKCCKRGNCQSRHTDIESVWHKPIIFLKVAFLRHCDEVVF